MDLQQKMKLQRKDEVTERQSDQASCSVRDLGYFFFLF